MRIRRIRAGERSSNGVDRDGVCESNSSRCRASGAVVIDLSENAAWGVERASVPRVQLVMAAHPCLSPEGDNQSDEVVCPVRIGAISQGLINRQAMLLLEVPVLLTTCDMSINVTKGNPGSPLMIART